MDGPLEWALEVLEHVSYARRMKRTVSGRLADLQHLTASAEWQAFASAAAEGGDPVVVNSLRNLGYWIDRGGVRDVLASAYRTGFRAGDVLGFLSAAGGVRASEASRNSGKVGLDHFLWEIIEAEGGPAKVKPYALAGQLIEDRDAGNDRGKRLKPRGLLPVIRRLASESLA